MVGLKKFIKIIPTDKTLVTATDISNKIVIKSSNTVIMCEFTIDRIYRQQSSQGSYKIPYTMIQIVVNDLGGLACVRLKQIRHTSDIDITNNEITGCIILKIKGDVGQCGKLLNNTKNSLVTKPDVTLINRIINSLDIETIIKDICQNQYKCV
ncbi:hypothetical protein DL89DRAFT_271280 [Linderina pennispora]|uniref:Uncharacterized protein n=1 Tax=Linderina pennispora TaxID=61395 RepID=A0A1Y1VW13_9FUNG|nr:uncharacterized protein DL89DRAFT_271280 [Linderina pennispora]ORX65205.1 hypothetical protein DL89DRAFT_271280 [Linderina pennispora]